MILRASKSDTRLAAYQRLSSLMFLFKSQMTDQIKTYANFNTSTFQGRVFDATVTEGKYGEFVAITIITNLALMTVTV